MASYNITRKNPIVALADKFGQTPQEGFALLNKGENNLPLKKQEQRLLAKAEEARQKYLRDLESRYNPKPKKGEEETMNLQKALEVLAPVVGQDLTDEALKKREEKAIREAKDQKIQAKKDEELRKARMAKRLQTKATEQDLSCLLVKFGK